jgi:CheY-like chemotaxis protein
MMDGNVKLLIVDDDAATRYSLCQIFSCLGHSVRGAEDGFSALRQIREIVPDIILSDLNMPKMSGFEFLSIIRRRFPSIYVIAMSGSYHDEKVPRGLAADGFHEKATGLATLFNAFKTATGSDQASLRASRTTTPIWIPQGRFDLARGREVLISCPDCMRAFSQTYENHGSVEEIDCAHCGSSINYAVVEPLAMAG